MAVKDINSDLLTTNKYYGIKAFDGQTGFISQEGYYTGKYIALCSNTLTHRNAWDLLAKPELSKMIEGLLKRGFEVYEFDTPKELWSWLAKNTV